MSSYRLTFLNIKECELFLSRFYSPEYEERTFILPHHASNVKSMEECSGANAAWRLPESYLTDALSKIANSGEFTNICSNLSRANIICGGREAVSPVRSTFGATVLFTNDDEGDNIGPSAKFCLDLILCVLSSAIDYLDAWSVTRFFSHVCPEVLPSLRRQAQKTKGGLNIMSILLSYVMSANFDKGTGDDAVLSSNFKIIEGFSGVVQSLTEELHSSKKPTAVVDSMIKKILKYMSSISNISGRCALDTVPAIIKKHLGEVSANMETLKANSSNHYQKRSPVILDSHILAFALRDRLYFLDVVCDFGSASPLFRTPVSVRTAKSSPVIEECVHDATPKRTPRDGGYHLHSPVRLDVPFSENNPYILMRTGDVPVENIEAEYGDEKENLDPNGLSLVDVGKKAGDMQNRRKDKILHLRCRNTNIVHPKVDALLKEENNADRKGGKVNAKKRLFIKKSPKKKQTKVENGQTKISHFFAKKN